MNNTVTALLAEPHAATPHRYQVYRQARNGLHYNHGPILDSADQAVALFLQTTPAFEGGGVRLWDHYDQRHVASAEWQVEQTRMGFAVRTRANAFHDEALGSIARDLAQREALVQAIASEMRMSA